MRSSMASRFLLKATRKVDRCERAFAFLTLKEKKQKNFRVVLNIHVCDVWKTMVEARCSAQTHVPR